MSVKIYNGFRLPAMSVFELWEWVAKLRKRLHPFFWDAYSCSIASRAVQIFDDWFFFQNYRGNMELSAVMIAQYSMLSTYAELYKSNQGDIWVGAPMVTFEITFHPLKDYVLGIYYSDGLSHQERASIVEMPGYEEYAYFNNTDYPEEISKVQWEQREKDWFEVIYADSPAVAGFSVNCIGKHSVKRSCRFKDLNPHFVLISNEGRANRLASKMIGDLLEKDSNGKSRARKFKEVSKWFLERLPDIDKSIMSKPRRKFICADKFPEVKW